MMRPDHPTVPPVVPRVVPRVTPGASPRAARRSVFRLGALAGLCLALSACGDSALRGGLDQVLAIGADTPPSQFTASRAELAAAGITGPLIKVVRRTPEPASAGYLAAGAANGTVFYQAADGSEVQLSAGLLMATVSFGGDLHGADVAPVARALIGGGGRYSRTLRHVRVANKVVETAFDCTLVPAAAETITVQGRAHATTRFTETCTAGAADPLGRRPGFTNQYWLDASGVRAGEHWVGPEVGMLRIEQVLP